MNFKMACIFGVLLLVVSCLYFGMITESKAEENLKFRFASYYQDNMVLQAAPHQSTIWGYGEINGVVEVYLNTEKMYSTKVTNMLNGTAVWSITLDPQEPGTRFEISANQMKGGILSVYQISNVVFGDVWICGGQSNMLFPVAHAFNYSEIIKKVSKYPDIRIFTAKQVLSPTPLHDLEGITQNWAVPSSESVFFFSAVCWLYATNLHDKLHTPMGLISSNWGGTPVEAWSSPRALSSCGLSHLNDSFTARKRSHKMFPRLIESVPNFKDMASASSSSNSVLWNAMIHPFLNMTIKGAIWYQGEANSKYHRDLYNCTFPAMIRDWRKSWFEATDAKTEEIFPFGFVQIGPLTVQKEDGCFPMIRWHQTADHGFVPNVDMPNTFMSVSLDLPDPDSPYTSIHPRDKQDDGLRLSAAALKLIYQVKGIDDGPIAVSAEQTLNTIRVTYAKPDVHVLLNTTENFEICCIGNSCDVSDTTPEGLQEWVLTKLLKYDSMSVIVDADKCASNVKKVRYAWATTPCEFKRCQVYNFQGFPALPFVMDVTSK